MKLLAPMTMVDDVLCQLTEARYPVILSDSWVVSWCCGSPNDVTFSLFCAFHYPKVQVFIPSLQIFISANECKISVGLSVPTNSLTNFDLIKREFN